MSNVYKTTIELPSVYYVAKIGGSRLRGAADYLRMAELAIKLQARVIIVSAMRGVTDELARVIREHDEEGFKDLVSYLEEVAIKYAANKDMEEWVDESLGAFSKLKEGCRDPQLVDEILALGERASMAVMKSALEELGLRSVALDGGEAGIVTDEAFTRARPLIRESRSRIRRRLNPLLEEGYTIVVAGFTGRTLDGRTTTMGRGASDLTATLVASALNTSRLYLVTNTPYLMSADPQLIPEAVPLREAGIVEVDAMANLGVKKFHPLTFRPLIGLECEVLVGSNPPQGTRIYWGMPPPDLKTVSIVKGSLAFIGRKAGELAKIVAEELTLPLLEAGEVYFKLGPLRGEPINTLREAHEVMRRYW